VDNNRSIKQTYRSNSSRNEYDPLKEEKLLKEEKMRTTEEQTNVYQCSMISICLGVEEGDRKSELAYLPTRIPLSTPHTDNSISLPNMLGIMVYLSWESPGHVLDMSLDNPFVLNFVLERHI